MNPLLLKLIALIYVVALITIAWWNRPHSLVVVLLNLILLNAVSFVISRIHRAYCAHYLHSQGQTLKWFGQFPKLVNRGSSPYPWWVYYHNYDAIALNGTDECRLTFHLYGPALALVRPTILCEPLDGGPAEQTDEGEPE